MTTCMSLGWNLPLCVGGFDRWRWRNSRLPSAGKTQNNLDSSKKRADKEHTQLFDLNPGAPGGAAEGGSNSWACLIPEDAGGLILHNTDGRNDTLKEEALLFPTTANRSLPQSVIRNLYDGKRNLILVGFCWMIKQGGFLSLNPREQCVKKRL